MWSVLDQSFSRVQIPCDPCSSDELKSKFRVRIVDSRILSHAGVGRALACSAVFEVLLASDEVPPNPVFIRALALLFWSFRLVFRHVNNLILLLVPQRPRLEADLLHPRRPWEGRSLSSLKNKSYSLSRTTFRAWTQR